MEVEYAIALEQFVLVAGLRAVEALRARRARFDLVDDYEEIGMFVGRQVFVIAEAVVEDDLSRPELFIQEPVGPRWPRHASLE